MNRSDADSQERPRVRGKRDSALVPLSHDHHQALAQALGLKQSRQPSTPASRPDQNR